MKTRITRKAVISTHTAAIQVGYCDLQRLLKHEQPYAYTAGGDGWNADVYSFGSVAIVTGYRTFGDINPPYELVARYEAKALAIDDGGQPWNERKELKYELLEQFITEVTK